MHNTDTITGNCDQWIYLGGADDSTIANLAKKAGCLPETISNMNSANEWLFIRGMKARMAEKEPAYRMKSRISETGIQAAK